MAEIPYEGPLAPDVTGDDLRSAQLRYVDVVEAGGRDFYGSGIIAVDRAIDGVCRGEMCVIGALSGHGKSALAFQWMDEASAAGHVGLIISQEMSDLAVGYRRLLSVSDLPEEDWGPETAEQLRVDVEMHHAGRKPCYLMCGLPNMDAIEAAVMEAAGMHDVTIVAIDYLQLIRASSSGSQYEIVTELSKRCKSLTVQANVAMLLPAQLNRDAAKLPWSPKMHHFRDSGQIEHDADLIIAGCWPWKLDQDVPKDKYTLDFLKRRNGPIRESFVDVKWDCSRQIFGGGVPAVAQGPEAMF